MSQAHYEAVRVSSERPYSMNGSRKSFLPSRMRRTPTTTTPDMKISQRFSQPNEEITRQVTHEHILVLGNQILTQMQRKNEIQIQNTYQQMLETERKRIETEYEQRSNAMAQKWKEQFDEEKRRLQKDFDRTLHKVEYTRQEQNRDDEQIIIKRMKDECDQALAKQWKIANEQLTLAVKQAEEQLRAFMELSYLQEKERFTKEFAEKKEVKEFWIEYNQREYQALTKMKEELTREHKQTIQIINDRHTQEMTALTNKLKLTEERFRREFSSRARLESDFRLLQTDYKRFMDHSNFFHSDYMLKLRHIGEQIGDEKFEEILDRILSESDIQTIPSKTSQNSPSKSKHISKTRPT